MTITMRDYRKEDFCNTGVEEPFAIELEVGINFKREYLSDYKVYSESENIDEFYRVHDLPEIDRMKVLDTCVDFYKDKFPVGRDTRISGGVHFHLFWEYGDVINDYQQFKEAILNCPLHLKIWKGVLYGRMMYNRARFGDSIRMCFDDKEDFISLKNEFWTSNTELNSYNTTDSIEFRCNNVIDSRILGFYQGVVLVVRKGIKLKKVSDTLTGYARIWDDNYYTKESCNWGSDLEMQYIKWIKLEDEDKKIVRANIKIIFDLLKEEGLTKSAEALREYLIENGIRYI